GKDFPVSLHAKTREQYALARTEQKSGPGYHGFSFDTSKTVSLEEDLARRDLTVNAMARDESGHIIDPYGGQLDLERKVLRHVSDAFIEDPLRVLRVARFSARFAQLGFSVAPETTEMMKKMSETGELDELRPERVWQETNKALVEKSPQQYFLVLRDCGALARVFPELEALFGVPQPARWHPEIDTGIHVMMALKIAAELSDKAEIRFAVLAHDLGKGTTPKKLLPGHRGHEERSLKVLASLCARLPVPKNYQALAEAVARYHGLAHKASSLRPNTLHKIIVAVDGIRRPGRFEDFLIACEADARGRKGLEEQAYPQAEILKCALHAARTVRAEETENSVKGKALGELIRQKQIESISAALKTH
ncbi:uncharacterized protein METZ01_LOCUS119275, partial [marine metagenome]